MRITKVTAHAFGPLVAQTLTLADGMTVVHGPNESAKSTWHAALYAAVCGRRRGALSREDREFEARHRPWDRDEWLVSAEIVLDDGRRVELRQDLSGRVDCHAIDLDLGTDLSAEILSGGLPDASRWLGLDRRSFASTASIAQATMLAVLEHPSGLQEHLQRAADTAGADATAAAALQRLDEFRRTRVGTDQVNSVRPLRKAIVAEQHAVGHVEQARAHRREYERSVLDLARLRDEAAAADRTLRLHEAAAARAAAGRLRARADEAVDLDRRLNGVQPRSSAAGDRLTAAVAAALATWHANPAAPDPPDGSRPQAPSAVPAELSLSVALTERTPHPSPHPPGPPPVGPHPPGPPGVAVPAGVTDDELWDLARRLELRREPVDPALVQRFHAARAQVAALELSRTRGRWLIAGAVGLALAAVALAVLRRPVEALICLLVGGGAVAASVVVGRGNALGAAQEELSSAEFAHVSAEQVAHDLLNQRRGAEARCAALGLPVDPTALRMLARASAGAGRDQQWQDSLADAHRRAGEQLLAVARQCGIEAATAAEAAPLLERWDRDRADRTEQADHDRGLWARRVALLDGRTLDDVVAEAAAAGARADGLAAEFTPAELREVTRLDDAWRAQLRAAAQATADAAAAAQGSLAQLERTLAPVTEAEEALARAEAELARVRELDLTLSLTRRFLVSAQERAHRDIAPVLAESVRAALPTVTGGRYLDVIVDPGTLAVRVCGPSRRWRAADQLSHGTAEQVYLLLRLALARHLVRPGTSCPLLLDDVTAHADAARVPALLNLLHAAAQDHQIVLFTQQQQVLEWARTNLTGPRHAVRELGTVATM